MEFLISNKSLILVNMNHINPFPSGKLVNQTPYYPYVIKTTPAGASVLINTR